LHGASRNSGYLLFHQKIWFGFDLVPPRIKVPGMMKRLFPICWRVAGISVKVIAMPTEPDLLWSSMKLCYNFKKRMVCLAPYLSDIKPITAGF
jgi:hypothetical protein